jgi:hypothetical protein
MKFYLNNYNMTRYVVERFFAWLKCGFGRLAIRYERITEIYLALIDIASFLMYWRVLRRVDYTAIPVEIFFHAVTNLLYSYTLSIIS